MKKKSNSYLVASVLQLTFISLAALLLALNGEAAQNQPDSSWTATGSLATARELHTATLLPSGKVLVAGGFGDDIMGSAELYDPAVGRWSATGSLGTARYSHTATLLTSGKVLVTAGIGSNFGDLRSAEVFDPARGTWTATGQLVRARHYHTATLLPSGKVLVAGGVNEVSGSMRYLKSAELYDPVTGRWTSAGSLGVARQNHTATLLPSGKVLVAGGYDGSSFVSIAELYGPSNREVDDDGQPEHGAPVAHRDAATIRQGVGGGRIQFQQYQRRTV